CQVIDTDVMRRFYAYWFHAGCDYDMGWIAVLDQRNGFCQWERNMIRPSFAYCPGSGPCLYRNTAFAKMFLVSARF
ncbi:hypothetical protein LSH36_61g05017, partial [Paralvinella palmiformis]